MSMHWKVKQMLYLFIYFTLSSHYLFKLCVFLLRSKCLAIRIITQVEVDSFLLK